MLLSLEMSNCKWLLQCSSNGEEFCPLEGIFCEDTILSFLGVCKRANFHGYICFEYLVIMGGNYSIEWANRAYVQCKWLTIKNQNDPIYEVNDHFSTS